MSYDDETCKWCGGRKDIRNPRGECDHLNWPENLSSDARRANGLGPPPRLVNATSEFFIGGLRFQAGSYAIQRVGPAEEFDPPF